MESRYESVCGERSLSVHIVDPQSRVCEQLVDLFRPRPEMRGESVGVLERNYRTRRENAFSAAQDLELGTLDIDFYERRRKVNQVIEAPDRNRDFLHAMASGLARTQTTQRGLIDGVRELRLASMVAHRDRAHVNRREPGSQLVGELGQGLDGNVSGLRRVLDHVLENPPDVRSHVNATGVAGKRCRQDRAEMAIVAGVAPDAVPVGRRSYDPPRPCRNAPDHLPDTIPNLAPRPRLRSTRPEALPGASDASHTR